LPSPEETQDTKVAAETRKSKKRGRPAKQHKQAMEIDRLMNTNDQEMIAKATSAHKLALRQATTTSGKNSTNQRLLPEQQLFPKRPFYETKKRDFDAKLFLKVIGASTTMSYEEQLRYYRYELAIQEVYYYLHSKTHPAYEHQIDWSSDNIHVPSQLFNGKS
jgi:hypothetical protein